MMSAWTADHVAATTLSPSNVVPAIDALPPIQGGEERYYWDMWPVQSPDGRVARLGEREMWMALSAPDRGDPALRHFEANIRWLERAGGRWIDRGKVMPDYDVAYERDWAGSALLDGDRLTLFFTGAGTADRPHGYQQRLYEASAAVAPDGSVSGWSVPQLSVRELTEDYCAADQHEGEPGRIKAFRDPAFFRDPADGRDYLIFTASLARSASAHNGAVGIVALSPDGSALLPPLVHADGVNNELERAHAVFHDGLYYLFWVTQRSTFAPELAAAPTGLYGMVADSLMGSYRPINGSGLVIANPEDDPSRTYSWFVSAEGVVSSFVDGSDPAEFAGRPAPLLRIAFEGDRCRVVEEIPV